MNAATSCTAKDTKEEEEEWKEILLFPMEENEENEAGKEREGKERLVFSWPDGNFSTSQWYGVTDLNEGKVVITMPARLLGGLGEVAF